MFAPLLPKTLEGMHDECVTCAKKCAVAMGANVLKFVHLCSSSVSNHLLKHKAIFHSIGKFGSSSFKFQTFSLTFVLNLSFVLLSGAGCFS